MNTRILLAAIACMLLTQAAIAQNDGPPAITWTRTVHVGTEITGGANTVALGEFPKNSVIERVYWCVDTTITEIDSAHLVTSGDTIIASLTGTIESPRVAVSVPNFVTTGGRNLIVALLPSGPDRTGQFKLVIVYRVLY